MKNIVFFPLLFLGILSCVQKKETPTKEIEIDITASYPMEVDLISAIKNMDETVKLSDFVEEIEYIPIESKDFFLEYPTIYDYDAEEDLFFLGDLYNVFAVDRSGRVVNKIGKRGDGPKDYIQVIDVSIDKKNKYVYVYGAYTHVVLKYDYQGNFIRKMFSVIWEENMASSILYNDDNFIAVSESYFFRLKDVIDRLFGFAVVDTTGKMIDISPSPVSTINNPGKNQLVQFMPSIQYTKFQGNYLLLSSSGSPDTIYTVEDSRLIPRFILNYGDEKPLLEKLWITGNGDERRKNIHNNIFIYNSALETERCFIIKLCRKGKEYIVFKDKKTGKNFSTLYDHYGFNTHLGEQFISDVPKWYFGFRNDIDGGVDTYPVVVSEKEDECYWVSYIPAEQMKELLTDDYFAGRKEVLQPSRQEELRKMVSGLNEDDNPVLILMKLKKGV